MKSDQPKPAHRGEITGGAEPEDSGPRQVIEQAASDIAHGLKDTDLHGIPSDVPGPVTADTPEAEVPPQGVGTRNYGEHQLGHKAPRK